MRRWVRLCEGEGSDDTAHTAHTPSNDGGRGERLYYVYREGVSVLRVFVEWVWVQ